MQKRRWGLAAALLAGAVAAAWWMSRPPAAPAVQVASGPLVRSLQFSARAATESSVEIGATLTGRVETVAVRAGQRVGAGAALLHLEGTEARAAVAQAEAALAQAKAALAGATDTRRRSAEAALAQAVAQAAAAQAEQRRTAELVARGFLSPARGDDAERALAVAMSQVDAARAQQDALGPSGSDLQQAEAQRAAAQAALQAARARLAQTVVRAPAAARVLQRMVEPGQIVQPGRALLLLALDGPLELVAQVDERFLEELQVGQRATVVADAYSGRPFEATLQRIAPRVDAQRGAIDLHFEPDAAPDFLRENMTLSVAVVTARRASTRVLPLAALRANDTAWVLRDGRVEARALTLGLRADHTVEVLDGLTEGDWVLLGSPPGPGSRARAVPAASMATGGGNTGATGAAMTQAMGR